MSQYGLAGIDDDAWRYYLEYRMMENHQYGPDPVERPGHSLTGELDTSQPLADFIWESSVELCVTQRVYDTLRASGDQRYEFFPCAFEGFDESRYLLLIKDLRGFFDCYQALDGRSLDDLAVDDASKPGLDIARERRLRSRIYCAETLEDGPGFYETYHANGWTGLHFYLVPEYEPSNRDWLAEFTGEPWVSLLQPFVSTDREEGSSSDRQQVSKEGLQALLDREPGFELEIEDGVTLIRMIASAELHRDHVDLGHELATFLRRFQDQAFVEAIEAEFEGCPERKRTLMIEVLAYQEPGAAAIVLHRLIDRFGCPRLYPRVFSKLNKHTEHVREYIVTFLQQPGEHIADATNLVRLAVERGHLDPAELNVCSGHLERACAQALTRAMELQPIVAGHWQRNQEYFYLRTQLGAWIDLIGIVPACRLGVLDPAMDLEDPLLSLFLVAALLERGLSPPTQLIERCASSYETLPRLYGELSGRDQLDLLPEEFVSFERFAAAEMVAWLMYPSELGEEPERIELGATLASTTDDGEPQQWCVWRVYVSEEESIGSVSGPYGRAALESPTPATVCAEHVFSNFTAWDEVPPEQHLEDVLETLDGWQVNRLC